MQALLISSLTVAIAATFGTVMGEATAIPTATAQLEQSELVGQNYTYRRYNSGTGRREILS